MVTALHLAESTFPLHLLFQCLERLLDIVIAHDNLNDGSLSYSLCQVRTGPIKTGRRDYGEPLRPHWIAN